jgi:hypothetical protein
VSCQKALTALAEESGNIAAMVQQEILSGDPDWFLKKIKEKPYDPSRGTDPRVIRFRTTPPPDTEYQPFLPTGNQDVTATNPQSGVDQTITVDKTGRGCSTPAEKIQYGYDVHLRCAKKKAWEVGPWCVWDLYEKKMVRPLIERLRTDIPRYGKETFGRQLARDVITYSTYKYTVSEGFPSSVDSPYFPAIPTGGPSIGHFRQIELALKGEGWEKGADTPMVGGRRVVAWRMSREAIEWAIHQRKKELGLHLDSRLYVDDGVWGQTVIYEGTQFIEATVPTKGYLSDKGSGNYEFVIIPHVIVAPAPGEGWWPRHNPDFDKAYVVVGGERKRVCEIAYAIHPTAMERHAMGKPPSMPGKDFKRSFNMEVFPIPDYELADRGCNKDDFWFGYRALHAYAPLPVNPELMTACIFLAPVNRMEVRDPWNDSTVPTLNPVSQAALLKPQTDGCLPCTGDDGIGPRDVTSPTSCSDLFPANGVGVIRQSQATYFVDEAGLAVTIVVNRDGGSTGASSVVATVTEGTATEPENFGIPTGATGTTGVSTSFPKTLNWADGEFGPKTLVVPINDHAGDDDGKQFTVVLSSATNSTLGTLTTATVTIIDTAHA